MKSCHAHHRRPLALAVAAAVGLLLCAAILPLDHWLGWLFERPIPADPTLQIQVEDSRFTRLVPAPRGPAPPATRARRPVTRAERPSEDRPTESEEDPGAETTFRWTYDPRSAGRATSELFDRTGVALPDSLLGRVELLQSLSLTALDPVLSMIDTSQVAVARAQFRGIMGWRSRVLGPAWTAQGQAERNAAIFHRVVTEVEREGVQ